MKTLPLLAASFLPLCASPENSLIPSTWFQEVTATDGSTQQCIIFTTVPGVEYTIYHSNDLVSWDEVAKTYGLGHEFAAAMRETAPAPPPPDPQNPPVVPEPLVSASISIARSSGSEGGIVVSWPSLDHGNAVRHLITATMATEWDVIPIFSKSHGGHWFAISPTSASVTPPESNGILGQNDAAMIADLEAGFASFNQAVISAVITALNTPLPPPPAPDSKGFWRIKADWTLDTDTDGSLDHVEFVLAAAEGAAADGLIGNAFNADSNADGIPDGEQLDGDGDLQPDSFDIAPNDELIGYKIIALPRYAVFETDPGARQINDRGTVLFEDKVWKNGTHSPLATAGDGMTDCYPRAMNDLDQFVGDGRFSLQDENGSDVENTGSAYWASPGIAPVRVKMDDQGETVHASGVRDPGNSVSGSYDIWSNRFSNDGEFHAYSFTWNPSGSPRVTGKGNRLWKIGGQAAQVSAIPAPASATNLNGSSVRWGVHKYWMEPQGAETGGRVFIPGAPEVPPFDALNVIPHTPPGGSTGYILTSISPNETTMIFYDGEWRSNELLAQAVDIADNGTAISKRNANDASPLDSGIMLNGKWTPLSRVAPGLPATWSGSNSVFLGDTTPGGWILARNNTKSAAMLPLRVKGRYIRDNIITEEATGVDDFSIGSSNPNKNDLDPTTTAVDDRIWIMAPQGGTPKEVVLSAPIHSSAPIKLSATGITFGGNPEHTCSDSETTMNIAATETATSGEEILLDIKSGAQASISKPIGFKVMKNRVIKVKVWKVYSDRNPEGTDPSAEGYKVPLGPNFNISEEELNAFLNDYFEPQINTTFDCEYEDVIVRFDTLDGTLYGAPADKLKVPSYTLDILDGLDSEFDPIYAAAHDGSKSINVYLLGSISWIQDASWIPSMNTLYWARIDGMADPVRRLAAIAVAQTTEEKEMDTIAHEIGHILFGEGHPDEPEEPRPLVGGSPSEPLPGGPAPLPGTTHTERLMCSGKKRPRDGSAKLIVKGEWDRAEAWLKDEEDEGRIDP